MAEDYQTAREGIARSLFSKLDDSGNREDTYVGHIKVWEDVPDDADIYNESQGMKPRYLMISIMSTGQGNIYKGKRNSNGTYSIGKRWILNDLRGIEVPRASALWLTLGRTYKFRTELVADVLRFVTATAHLYERLHPGQQIRVTGVQVPPLVTEAAPVQPPPNISAARRRPAAAEPVSASTSPPSTQSPPPRSSIRPVSSGSHTSAPGRGVTSTAANSIYEPPPRSRPPAITSASIRSSAATSAAGSGTRSPRSAPSALVDDEILPPNPPFAASQARSRSNSRTTVPDERVSRTSSPAPYQSSHAPLGPSSTVPSIAEQSRDYHSIQKQPQTPTADAQSLSLPPIQTQGSIQPSPIDPTFGGFGLTSLDDQLGSPTDDDLFGLEATMNNVEEMIDGFEWSTLKVDADSTSLSGKSTARRRVEDNIRGKGAADQIQARLQDELSALEKANIHSFLESDDRVLAVMKLIDETVAVIDDLDGYMASYKGELNTVADDISYIQSRNRGLQVTTQNQNLLLGEVEQLLDTVHVDVNELLVLMQASLETDQGIHQLEETAGELYKAMQAAREKGMAATMERLDEYRTYNLQFTQRLTTFLSVKFQAAMLENSRDDSQVSRGSPKLPTHEGLESYIRRYAGLVLYTREMDEPKYAKICGSYFSVASEMHAKEMKPMMTAYLDLTKKAADDGEEFSGFNPTPTTLSRIGTVRRNNTVVKSPHDRKDREKGQGNSLAASEALSQALSLVTGQIYREEAFIADFLQIHDGNQHPVTFADWMQLESYFRRQAARTLVLGGATKQLIRGGLDLIFGFLPETVKNWVDGALAKDGLQLVGIMATLERYGADAEDRNNGFVVKLLQKQSSRLSGQFIKLVDDQIRGIEQTKLTTKKRSGVVYFIKYFPIFVSKLEIQLIGADTLEVRATVDGAYDKIVGVMFESLQQMAKMSDVHSVSAKDQEEDKAVLNFHVILIENMHYFIAEISQQELGAMQGFLRRAQSIYDENLSAYVKLVMRRPMGKILDFFDGIERQLKTTAPTQVSFNGSYSKSALKKVVKEYSSKDLRKHVEVLYKRVEKHFEHEGGGVGAGGGGNAGTEEGSALQDVWKACELEMVGYTETFSRLISQCYEGSGVSVEWTVGEAEQYFRSARRGR